MTAGEKQNLSGLRRWSRKRQLCSSSHALESGGRPGEGHMKSVGSRLRGQEKANWGVSGIG